MAEPTLGQRARLALAGSDTGQRRVAWADLTALDDAAVLAFQTALQLEADRRHLELKVIMVTEVTGNITTFDGIEVRWRPARGMTL